MKSYTYKDGVFTFEGSISVQEEKQWCRPWRIPFDRIDLYPYLSGVAGEPSGVRISFTTNSQNAILKLHEPTEGIKLDLYSDGIFFKEQICNNNHDVFFSGLYDNMKEIEIWLDPRYPFYLESISVDDNAFIRKTVNTKKRWIHYGSSISHSREAAAPSKTWAGIVAMETDFHLTNIGFAANCILEPMVGKMIRDTPADLITLKLGINCHSGALSRRAFEPNAIGLISLIREKHPDTPLKIISPIYSPEREITRKLDISLTLPEIREVLEAVVLKFQKYGDRAIDYIDGLNILGSDGIGYLPDKLHPNAEGQYIMAKNFMKFIHGNKGGRLK